MDQSEGIVASVIALCTVGLGLLAKVLHSRERKRLEASGEEAGPSTPPPADMGQNYQVLFAAWQKIKDELDEQLRQEREANSLGRERIDRLERAVLELERMHAEAESMISRQAYKLIELERERDRYLAEVQRKEIEIRRLEARLVDSTRTSDLSESPTPPTGTAAPSKEPTR